MQNQFNDIFSHRELLSLASIVQVGDKYLDKALKVLTQPLVTASECGKGKRRDFSKTIKVFNI